MKECVLIHPRRLTRIMREYLQQVIDATGIYHTIQCPKTPKVSFAYLWEHCDDASVWEDDSNWEEVPVAPTVVLKSRKNYFNFGVATSDYCEDEDATEILFEYDIATLLNKWSRNYDRGLGFVTADMGRRASYMKGFAQVTRILLHEIGHVASYDDVHAKYTDEELSTLHQQTKGNRKYIQLPDEFAATQWAIDWLADEQHRKAAKEFEKKFWSCFA